MVLTQTAKTRGRVIPRVFYCVFRTERNDFQLVRTIMTVYIYRKEKCKEKLYFWAEK